jgi:hypothetical protein
MCVQCCCRNSRLTVLLYRRRQLVWTLFVLLPQKQGEERRLLCSKSWALQINLACGCEALAESREISPALNSIVLPQFSVLWRDHTVELWKTFSEHSAKALHPHVGLTCAAQHAPNLDAARMKPERFAMWTLTP